MIIETKYSPDDWVFVLDGNKIHKRLITHAKAHISVERVSTVNTNTFTASMPVPAINIFKVVINYTMREYDNDKGLKREYNQDEVFANKQDLLNSL